MKLTEVKVASQNNDKNHYDVYGYVDFMNSRDAQRILNSIEVLHTDIRIEGGENWEDVMKSMVYMTKSEVNSVDRKFQNLHRHFMKMDPKYPSGAYGGYAKLTQLDRIGRIDEAKYASPTHINLTGTLYTGTGGDDVEKGVSVSLKCGKEQSHGQPSNPHMISQHCVIKKFEGGELANNILSVDQTINLRRSSEGWAVHGYNRRKNTAAYGDSWIIFDPDHATFKH